jgi:DNA-binding winged helix-turn-helix (wHTH) protein
LEGDRQIRLGSRALDLLIALVDRPGQVMGKDELMARVWPDTFVDEGNLRLQISALRRALGIGHGGNRYLTLVPGRGYCFIAPVNFADDPHQPVLRDHSVGPEHNLPALLTRLVGRTETISRLAGRLARQRAFSRSSDRAGSARPRSPLPWLRG